MSYKCSISGKAGQFGNRVSHAKNRTRHVFKPNLQSKRLFVPSLGKYVRVRVSTKLIRTIDRLGIEATLKKFNMSVKDLVG